MLQEALDYSRRETVPAVEVMSNWGLATVHEQENRAQPAERHHLRVLEQREQTQDTHDTLPPLCAAVTFFAVLGRERETAKCAEALAAMTAATGNPEALAGLAHALGETALLNGNAKEAVEQFKQALQQFEKMQVPLDEARADYRLGVAYTKLGSKDDAVRHLKKAYRATRRLGARPIASRIADDLEKLGASAEERRSSEAPERAVQGGLTARQLEILGLIAEGLTNKEVAEKLYLSPRTVDMHVGHILERLDCRGRMEAVKKAAELGILQ
jgi:DNA-binding NarL/FixJ family response regulator